MKRLSHPNGAGKSFFNDTESILLTTRKKDKVKLSFFLPKTLHAIITEIAYREGMTLGQFILTGLEMNEIKAIPLSSDEHRKQMIRTSSSIPQEVYKKIKDTKHYAKGRTTISEILYNSSFEYANQFKNKYPELFE